MRAQGRRLGEPVACPSAGQPLKPSATRGDDVSGPVSGWEVKNEEEQRLARGAWYKCSSMMGEENVADEELGSP